MRVAANDDSILDNTEINEILSDIDHLFISLDYDPITKKINSKNSTVNTSSNINSSGLQNNKKIKIDNDKECCFKIC